MATDTSLRAWVNAYWEDHFTYPFDDWAADRIERGASSKGMSREVSAMMRDRAGLNDGTLRNWFPELRDDSDDKAAA